MSATLLDVARTCLAPVLIFHRLDKVLGTYPSLPQPIPMKVTAGDSYTLTKSLTQLTQMGVRSGSFILRMTIILRSQVLHL